MKEVAGRSKMNKDEKEKLANAMIELIETHGDVRKAVMHCAFCSPNIVTVV